MHIQIKSFTLRHIMQIKFETHLKPCWRFQSNITLFLFNFISCAVRFLNKFSFLSILHVYVFNIPWLFIFNEILINLLNKISTLLKLTKHFIFTNYYQSILSIILINIFRMTLFTIQICSSTLQYHCIKFIGEEKKKMWRKFVFCVFCFHYRIPSALNFVAKIKSDKNFVPISFCVFVFQFYFVCCVLMTKNDTTCVSFYI